MTTTFVPRIPYANNGHLKCVKIAEFPSLHWYWRYEADEHETPTTIESIHFWKTIAQMAGVGDAIEVVWPDGTRAFREVVSIRGDRVLTEPRDKLKARAA